MAEGVKTYDIYNREYFLSDCEGFAQFKSSFGMVLGKRLKKVFTLADILPGMLVLDIGCGRGELVLQSAICGASAFGVDFSRAAIEMAKGALRRRPEIKGGVLFSRAKAESLPFKDEIFDVIFLSDVVEHLKKDILEKTLRETGRVLRAGGRIILHTSPNYIFLHYGLFLYSALGRLYGKKLSFNLKESLPYGCRSRIHVNEQTVFRLKRLFKGCGFGRVNLWLTKNPQYVYYFLKDDAFIRRINALYRFLPFKHLFYSDIYGIITK